MFKELKTLMNKAALPVLFLSRSQDLIFTYLSVSLADGGREKYFLIGLLTKQGTAIQNNDLYTCTLQQSHKNSFTQAPVAFLANTHSRMIG